MQLQRQLNRVVAGKEYPKYLLVVPPDAVQQLEWKVGEELKHEVKDQSLIIRKTEPVSQESMKIARKYAQPKRK
ncbi:MAG: hypothetical protein ABSD49_14685 [Candidatus Bathyarchaeia archaeon]|jgi:antitoxin component of MazEF toxin-antitoxin module